MKQPQKGQSLVEFALVVVFFMGLVVLFVDFSPLAFNLYMSKQLSARGARAGSVYLADGTRTCSQDVLNAIGDPWLPFSTYTVEISEPCNGNPLETIAAGTPITVRVDVTYSPPFVGGFMNPLQANTLSFSQQTIEQAR
jgi:Flp pilus assembly protein TadG